MSYTGVQDEDTLKRWRDLLRFTCKGDFIRSYNPIANRFKVNYV